MSEKKNKYSDWIAANYSAAETATAGTGIFPEILLSQAIIESASGGKMPGTILAKAHNNYFGIKAGSWPGKTVNMITGEFDEHGNYSKAPAFFRVYSSPADSFKDYVKLLHNKRYAKVLTATTPRAQAQELQAAGYSTNPKYSDIIASLAETIKGAGKALKMNSGKAGAAAAAAIAAAVGFYFLTSKKGNGK